AVRDFFIYLSKNKTLNQIAKKWGHKLGAQNVVAGTNIAEMVANIKKLNSVGISCTIDNLGEFVYEKEVALRSKEQIIAVIEAIHENNLDAHISLKPSQLGLDIDFEYCLGNLCEIVQKAKEYHIFINVDMEDHARIQASFDVLDDLSSTYDNIGTVI